MDAITLILAQHRELAGLFDAVETADDPAHGALLDQLADLLAIHTTIEERVFYPACHRDRTEALLWEALEDHLAIKRLTVELLELGGPGEEGDPRDPFALRLAELRAAVEAHFEAEETLLLPRVARLLDAERLDQLGTMMTALAEELRQREPRRAMPSQIESLPFLD